MFTLAMLLTASIDGRLDLVCLGGGSANKQTSSQAYVSDNYGNSASGTITGTERVGFDDQVNLWIEGSEGRLRMPRTMLPLLRGGDGGWFKIKNIKIEANEITGSVAVNVINNPKLVIDRRTGVLSLSGKAGSYVGSCKRYSPNDMPNQF